MRATLASAREQLNGTGRRLTARRWRRIRRCSPPAAAVRDAWLALRRTHSHRRSTASLRRRSVQVGQRVAAGTPLMGVVPLTSVGGCQLQGSAATGDACGQPVTLGADIYGGTVVYHGSVVGLAAGTGTAFASAALAECLRELDQDRAAPAGSRAAGSRGATRSPTAHRDVGERSRVDIRNTSGSLVPARSAGADPLAAESRRRSVGGGYAIDRIIHDNLGDRGSKGPPQRELGVRGALAMKLASAVRTADPGHWRELRAA